MRTKDVVAPPKAQLDETIDVDAALKFEMVEKEFFEGDRGMKALFLQTLFFWLNQCYFLDLCRFWKTKKFQ